MYYVYFFNTANVYIRLLTLNKDSIWFRKLLMLVLHPLNPGVSLHSIDSYISLLLQVPDALV